MPGLFDKLPFKQAIESLRERLAIDKDTFLRWDAANRSRAFTMARAADLNLLQNIHDEISQAISEGETYRDFEKRMGEVMERTGWTGSEPWHYRLVYDTNLGMAYSAGSIEQGRELGMKAWRYLPSLSDEPRVEHERYYNQLFRFEPGSPVPPIDFNCACGWEWVFPEELEAEGIDARDLPVFDPPTPRSGFVWSPSDYSAVGAWPVINASVKGAKSEKSAKSAKSEKSVKGEAGGDLQNQQAWLDAAVGAAAELAARKLAALREWMSERARAGMSLEQIRDELGQAAAAIAVPEETELNSQVLMAAWLNGAASVGRTMIKNAKTSAEARGLKRMICEPATVDGLDGRIMLIRWGDNKRRDGLTQIVDMQAALDIIREFNARKIDMVIDWEHQSEGGEFAAPDGLAPAAGWIKAGSLSAVPGEGIYGQVNWTKRAAKAISEREYRYLSPVTWLDPDTHRVMVLDKVALTNTPAIEGFPALINKQGASAPERNPNMEALLSYLREVLGMDASASPEDILAKLKGGEAEQVANKMTAEALAEVARGELADAGGTEIAEAIGKGDKGVLVGTLTRSINRLKNQPGKVDASEYQAVRDRLAKLESDNADRECEALIVANSAKLPPAKHDWFKTMYHKDGEFARQWIKDAPELVVNKQTAAASGTPAGPPDRAMLINSARAKLREERGSKTVLCSERAWVNSALREAGQSVMSEDEVKSHAIACD